MRNSQTSSHALGKERYRPNTGRPPTSGKWMIGHLIQLRSGVVHEALVVVLVGIEDEAFLILGLSATIVS